MKTLPNKTQIAAYNRLRGYGDPKDGGGHGGSTGGHGH